MKLRWGFIKNIADSRVVKSSYIWLFIVPLSAKLLSSLDEVISLTIFSGQFKLVTTLPFSWQLFFFASCLFTLANILYSIFCPEIFKSYKSYLEFKDEGKTLIQLHSAMKGMTIVRGGPLVREGYGKILQGYFKHYCDWKGEIGEKIETPAMSQFDNMQKATTSGVVNNAFYFVQNVADTYNQRAIWVSTGLYYAGLVFVGYIAIENVVYVIKSIG